MKHVLVTGVAGFIGFTVTSRLLERGDKVFGIDNLNSYYDPSLKLARLELLKKYRQFAFEKVDIADRANVARVFRAGFDTVLQLAAQVGVRYSIENPLAYVDANLVGFANVLEGCRRSNVKHLVFASSSSVYGANARLPFSEHVNVDHPVSLYAATKKANELMAHTYAYLYGFPCTGLRFFTVYGPWGRPDMAYFKFTRNILEGNTIEVFNKGDMARDFTYIDDIVEGVVRIIDHVAEPDPSWNPLAPDPARSQAPYRIFNIGNNNPVHLMRYIEILEECIGKKAKIEMLPMQAGEVQATMADVSDLESAVGYRPNTPVEVGVRKFVDWYKSYYGV